MDLALIVLIQVLYAIASLALISVGLAIIFGMMGVINFAHGEFLMMGGYAFVLSVGAGVNFWISMLVVAPVTVGIIGIIIERLIIRHLYGRIMETVLATWGLSLFLIGLAATVLGYHQKGVAPPLGNVVIGTYREGGYTFFVIGITIVLLLIVYAGLKYTKFGLIARGTMQNADMSSALGVSVNKIYAVTFGVGAALSGLAGAVLAPIAGVLPDIGVTYVIKAFITVISGGAVAFSGTVAAAILFGAVNQTVTFLSRPVVGEVALLVVAIVLLRLLPNGITGKYFRKTL
ncbi:MAG: branched-chain amino acid ABC transporter permease [Alphaproteobacteria bacterium]|jgi:branched-subunit amino acid ABC-type transport system permease component|nr:branched-chain amino acid ABC transporter permease [Alphaproteobacteria bacterium]